MSWVTKNYAHNLEDGTHLKYKRYSQVIYIHLFLRRKILHISESHVLLKVLWAKNAIYQSSKQRMVPSSSHHITAALMLSPERTLDKAGFNQVTDGIKYSTTVATPLPRGHPEGANDDKHCN